ncbi:hypothetical protein BA6E_102127 [Bacteroidales bacterium 6E]|nr:hypothetical protein BA6E_102127 [Bacteroidales bacterium 6E]
MKQKIPFVFHLMHVLFYIVFIGLSIKAGVLVISFIISLAVSAQAASNLYMGIDLSELFKFDKYHYISIMVLAIIIAMLKASIAMMAVGVASGFNIDKPFNTITTHMITGISRLALFTGILAIIAQEYIKWLSTKNISVPLDMGGQEILFFAGVIYMLAKVFEKGVELQSENELTV